MKNKISLFGGSLLLLCLLFTTNLSGQISVGLTASDSGCDMGTICLGCDGSLTVTSTGTPTQIKLYGVSDFTCDAGDGTDAGWYCSLCDVWDMMWGAGVEGFCANQTWTFPPGSIDPNGNAWISFQSEGGDAWPEGCDPWGYADFNLSQFLAQMQEEECREEPNCPSQDFSEGWDIGLVDAFVVPSNSTLDFSFYTQNVPDQLIVTVNCEEVINSTPYSSDLSESFLATASIGSCGVGNVDGNNMDVNYVDQINVSAGDVVSIQVIEDPCNWGSTYWNLTVACGLRNIATFTNNGNEDHFIFTGDIVDIAPQDKESILPIEYFTPPTESEIETTLELPTLTAYPNPAKDFLTYSLNPSEEPYQITIFNMQGQMMYSAQSYGGTTDLSLSDFANGLYVIQAVIKDQLLMEKIQVIK